MNREDWLQGISKWPKLSRPFRDDSVCSSMKRHFHSFSFSAERTPTEPGYPGEFRASMESVLGVPLIEVDNTGPNGFFDAFCVGYIGKRGNTEIIQRLRHCVSAYVVFGWHDRNLRDWFIGSFPKFVSRNDNKFDLLGALSLTSNNPISTSFRNTEDIEMHCVGLVMNCQIVVISLNSDYTVSCAKFGSPDASNTIVYCVRTKKHEYFGLGVPTSTSTSNSYSSSDHQVVDDDGTGASFTSPPQFLQQFSVNPTLSPASSLPVSVQQAPSAACRTLSPSSSLPVSLNIRGW